MSELSCTLDTQLVSESLGDGPHLFPPIEIGCAEFRGVIKNKAAGNVCLGERVLTFLLVTYLGVEVLICRV